MQDLRDRLERLRVDAEDCALVSKLATDRAKREVFDRLAAQTRLLIVEVEEAIDARIAAGKM